MATNVEKLDSELKKAVTEIKKLVAQLKKGSDPKVVKQVRDLMTKYNATNVDKAYDQAVAKDKAAMKKILSEINPGL